MNDNWKKLQKEVINKDTRFMSSIDKKINHLKNVINDPDGYNTNLASKDRMDKVERSIEDLAVHSHKPINFTKRLDELHNKIDSIYSLLETLSDRLNLLEYTGMVSYGNNYDVGRTGKIVQVKLARKDALESE